MERKNTEKEAPMEIALSEDILKYLGFEGGIGDKITSIWRTCCYPYLVQRL